MIKVTIAELLNASHVLGTFKGRALASKKAFSIARMIREISRELETYEQVRVEIIKKYANKDENGEMIIENGNAQILDEFIEKCRNELEESCAQEVEINVAPLKEEWLEEIELTVDDAMLLEPFMEK